MKKVALVLVACMLGVLVVVSVALAVPYEVCDTVGNPHIWRYLRDDFYHTNPNGAGSELCDEIGRHIENCRRCGKERFEVFFINTHMCYSH